MVALTVAILMVVLAGSAALTFDLARLRHERHLIQAAVDLGSLAGATLLPVSTPATAAAAEATARQIAVQNAPKLASAGLSINFACVVSDPEGNGGGDAFDLGFACGSHSWTGGWTSRGGKAIHACDPYTGIVCNTIRMSASSVVPYFFAPVLGFDQGNTGAVRAAACQGYCGQSESPLDVVLVIDRTSSMSVSDIANLKDAILDTSTAEDSMLEYYDPSDVSIGLVALPYKSSSNPCAISTTQTYRYPAPTSDLPRWQVVGLSNDYRLPGGALNPGSTLVQDIQCLQRAGSTNVTVNGRSDSHGQTNHGEPLRQAQALLNQGRPDAPNVIVFFADGESNEPYGFSPCSYAVTSATNAKAAGTTFFSLAYGAVGARCQYDTGSWANAWATRFLSTAASPFTATGLPSNDNQPGGCATSENADGDFYFCESRGEDLQDVFKRIAVQSLQRSRLLNF